MSYHPILLTCADLLAPIELATTTLREVRQQIPQDKHASLARKGLFVLAVSSLEVMIADVLSAPHGPTEEFDLEQRAVALDVADDLIDGAAERLEQFAGDEGT